jgi:hypothetical protein
MSCYNGTCVRNFQFNHIEALFKSLRSFGIDISTVAGGYFLGHGRVLITARILTLNCYCWTWGAEPIVNVLNSGIIVLGFPWGILGFLASTSNSAVSGSSSGCPRVIFKLHLSSTMLTHTHTASNSGIWLICSTFMKAHMLAYHLRSYC